MYIDSIIIEGFKSYAQRTVISGFHQHFNAITGLNGSGKSNVLDAICFVLGISNLSQVRAQNLQDLVYKKGQAGIQKASVQLVFNNEDKATSPHGYEQQDQIIVLREIQVGGGSKYKINGKNADQSKVHQLFRSVQLNVNNPTFLIMQGRVTKVLNMKPPEILAMVEEAAGTKMYEANKNNAVKLIDKKEKKLAEIQEVLDNEIGPRMRQLNEERSVYLTFQKNQQELEKLEKVVVAHDFHLTKADVKQLAGELQETEDQLRDHKARVERLGVDVEDAEANLDALRRKREQEMGGGLRDLEKEVQEVLKQLVTQTTILGNKDELLQAEHDAKARLLADIHDTGVTIAAKEADLARGQDDYAGLARESDACAHELEQTQQAILTSQAGMAGGANLAKSFAEQLRDAENDATAAATAAKQAEMRHKHAQAEYKKKKPLAANAEKAHAAINAERAACAAEVAALEARIADVGYDEAAAVAAAASVKGLEAEARGQQDVVDQMQARLASLCFDYADPHPGFDRRKVHGLVARLIRVHDAQYATALEVAAGGKLYNVVVDTQDTGAKLLKGGRLKQRVTIIPLDKIAAKKVASEALACAEKEVGKGNSHLALSLVGYPEDVERAMQYVFGSTIVCATAEAAQKVTFHKAIRARSVTVDGDVYEPAGTLTGGARTAKASVLAQLQELAAAEERLADITARLAEARDRHAALKALQDAHAKASAQWQLKHHELELLDGRIRGSTHGQQLLELAALEQTMADQQAAIGEARAREEEARRRADEIQRESKDYANNAEAEVKKLEKQVAALKKKAAAQSAAVKAKHHELDAVRLEIDELRRDLKGAEAKVAGQDAAIATAQEVVSAQAAHVAEIKAVSEEKQKQLDKKRAKLAETDSGIAEMEGRRRAAIKERGQLEVQLKKLANARTRIDKDLAEARNKVAQMYKEHKWIEGAEASFGVAGGTFDFETDDVGEYRRRAERLRDEQKKLRAQVNMKALAMMEDIKKEHDELLKKKAIVEKDKDKILQSIEELDKKKAEALERTHAQVNKDFGSIFSTLLPGTQARLEAPPGMTVQEGLEVKVAFGTTWKESLTELSGGQRSLIALSLILALLLFKPAPMYILDEIDAALDLSHTQNIGKMLRTHFSQSQFIVVSLKEGMFNNANVLYRVRFVDGTSTVTRYAHEASAEENAAPQAQAQEGKRRAAAAQKAQPAGRALAPANR